MKNGLEFLIRLSLCAAILILPACTKSGGGGDDAGTPGTTEPAPDGKSFTSDCGIILGGSSSVRNPVDQEDGTLVSIDDVVSPTVVIIRTDSGPVLVKLHGIRNPDSDFRFTAGINQLRGFGTSAIFFSAGDSCDVVVDGGGSGIAGQLFTVGGQSFAEALLGSGNAVVDEGDVCNASELRECYTALVEGSGGGAGAAGNIDRFIWKPQSERNGNLVVLVDAFNAVITANGERLDGSGPSNGFGTTSRSNKPGCAFGSNVRVEVFDATTGEQYTIRGADTLIIPNGCNRVQFG